MLPVRRGGGEGQDEPKANTGVVTANNEPYIPSGAIVHIKSLTTIYTATDYNLFIFEQGNRTLNKKKIKKIKDEIAAGTNLLKECPIIVVERKNAKGETKLYIMDGQHRFQVCKDIGHQVYYVIRVGLSLYEIAQMNSNTEKWSAEDYIKCYTTVGNEHYKTLSEFKTAYGFSVGICLELLAKGLDTNSHTLMEKFKAGQFEVQKHDEAIQIADQVLRFDEFKNYNSREFVITIAKLMKEGKVTLDDIHAAYEKRKDLLVHQKNSKNYITCLESIYNVGKQKRIYII